MNFVVDPLPNYRRASERWANAPTLAQCYTAISSGLAGNNHGLVEHVKAFIECVCVTVLNEFGCALPSNNPGMTELLVEALKPLGLQNSRGASKLDKILSAFNKLSDAINEMRNEVGPVAHGKDAFLDSLSADHARAFLHTGDAIVGVLLNAMEGKEPNLLATREPYERFQHLCDRIDRSVTLKAEIDADAAVPVLVVSLTIGLKKDEVTTVLRIEPSRLLYGLDRNAFVETLNEIPTQLLQAEPDDDLNEIELEDEPSSDELSGAPRTPLVVGRNADGVLNSLRPALEGFLTSEGLRLTDWESQVNALLSAAEENMGIDWQSREGLQSRLKVMFRRILIRFGCDKAKADDGAERLVSWLRIQAPNLPQQLQPAADQSENPE